MKKLSIVLAFALSTVIASNLKVQAQKKQEPLQIEKQGSFAVGGTKISDFL